MRAFFSRGKLGTFNIIMGLLFLLFGSAYATSLNFFAGDSPLTAGQYIAQICNRGNSFYYAIGSCAQAHTDVLASEHLFTLGAVSIVLGAFWLWASLRRRFDRQHAWLAFAGGWSLFWLVGLMVAPQVDRIVIFLISGAVTAAGYYVREHGWPKLPQADDAHKPVPYNDSGAVVSDGLRSSDPESPQSAPPVPWWETHKVK